MLSSGSQALNISVPVSELALSEVGACRAFDHLSADGATLLMGMIRVMSRSDNDEAVVYEAASTMNMPNKAAIRGLRDLCRSGLLRRDDQGALVLHWIFGRLGHELSTGKKQQVAGAFGYVVALHGKDT